MSKTKQFALALGSLAILGGTNAFAQRTVDLEPSLDAPAYGTEFTNGDNVQVTVSLKNNGPDDLVTGDTVFFAIPYNQGQQQVSSVILTQGLAAGQSLTLIDQQLGLSINGITEQTSANLCVAVFNPDDISINQVPVSISYTDNNTDNNMDCTTVIVDPADNGGGDNGGGGSGIANVPTYASLNLYPNPARSIVNFNINLQEVTDVTAVVRDVTGREVLQQSFGKVQAGNNVPLQINVADFAPGMYIIELSAGDQQYMGKVNILK